MLKNIDNSPVWIWYPGDFELYHGMKQNFSRVERGFGWPAFWKSEGFRNRIVFRRTYELKEETEFQTFSTAVGYVLVQELSFDREKKYPLGQKVTCGPGSVKISVHLGKIEAFPSVYIKGDVIFSDKGWDAEDYSGPAQKAGWSRYFTREDQDPANWDYSEKVFAPVKTEEINGGVLYELETELTAVLEISYQNGYRPLKVYCGESREEALDLEHCYYSWEPDPRTGRCPRCAVRFAFIPRCRADEIRVKAIHQYVDIPVRASFEGDDELLNRIWKVSEHTFALCSGVFFIDGIKRDKWIWSGDAYQSILTNQYLLADPDIDRTTLLALRGNDPMTTHINTIIDYSLFWILGVGEHYKAYGDREFLEQIYPKMCSLMNFCAGQVEEHGFFTGREGDWVYIDWADMDKTGALCAEQMLFAKCWDVMAEVSRAIGREDREYADKYRELLEKINAFYWDEEKGAFIDSFASGRRCVTRHANIFAIIYDLAEEGQKQSIVKNVLFNDEVPQITTPYFKFYEMDALCKMGYLQEVLEKVKEYWGGMLERGAVTFWEEYDPNVSREEQYDMYGDKFGKSLCHAWSASPIYLLAKYFVGLQITDPMTGEYEIHPHLEGFGSLCCSLPVRGKQVKIHWDKEKGLKVTETEAEERPAF